MLFSESFPPGFVSKFKHFKDLRRFTSGPTTITMIVTAQREIVRAEGDAPLRTTWQDGMNGHGQDAIWKTGGPRAPIGRDPHRHHCPSAPPHSIGIHERGSPI